MVIGSNVTTVQRVSRYCLEQGAEVFPYYGTPTAEEIALFDPEVLVLCLPIPEDVLHQLSRPCILWSEQLPNGVPLVHNHLDLQARLQEVFQA